MMINDRRLQWAALIGLTLWIQPVLRAQTLVRSDKPGMLFYEPAPGNSAAGFRLSVIQSRNYGMVFVHGVLAATYSFARRDAGMVGLFFENATGKCVVGDIHARQPQ